MGPQCTMRAFCHDEAACASDYVPVSCRHPVKNVTAGNEMAAPGHHSLLFSTEIEHKLLPGSHDGSPNVRFQYHFLGAVASEKINKEYVCKYKYIQRRQNVSDRAVNDNTVGELCEMCVLSFWKAMTSIPPDISSPPIPSRLRQG